MPYGTQPWNNPYLFNPYLQQMQMQQMPVVQQQQQQQQQTGMSVKVDGPNEAMNRFLMMYPASQLVPGFISEALFDVNGKQFHALSVEADGRRNLETFDFFPHVDNDGAKFVSRQEFDDLVAKVNEVNAAIGANDGIHGPVRDATE